MTDEAADPRKEAVQREANFLQVAAGMLGKVHCRRLFALGAVVVDIGAVADILMRKNTRDVPPKFKELALVSENGDF